jgi:hypothetical protein
MTDPFAQYHGNPLDDLRAIARRLARAKRDLLKSAGLADPRPDKRELLKDAAERRVTMLVKQPPSVHRVPQDLAHGRVGETTIEDRGAELTPQGADIAKLDDGVDVPFWDVSKGTSKALVGTRQGIADWLAENLSGRPPRSTPPGRPPSAPASRGTESVRRPGRSAWTTSRWSPNRSWSPSRPPIRPAVPRLAGLAGRRPTRRISRGRTAPDGALSSPPTTPGRRWRSSSRRRSGRRRTGRRVCPGR